MESRPGSAGVIKCICRLDHDDGFTIQCEECSTWQHGHCVGIANEDEAPEVFLCNKCGNLSVDEAKAREKQLLFLRKRNRKRSNDVGANSPAGPSNRNKKRKDSGIVDNPMCFLNSISKNEFLNPLDVFGRDLAVIDEVPDFQVEIKRVSSTFNMTAFGIFTTKDVESGDFCSEIIGQVDWLRNYKKNPFNQYKLMGCPKPGVLFIDEVVLDSRIRGNYGAFVHHSSSPNTRIAAFKDRENNLRFLLVAVQHIPRGSMLTLPWMWDPKHPIYKPLQSLVPAQTAIIEASLNRLREFGLEGTMRSFLPSTKPRSHVPEPSSPVVESVAPDGHAAAGAVDHSEPGQKAVPPEPSTPIAGFVWQSPVAVAAVEEAPKKRLSLADYKKKRPSVI